METASDLCSRNDPFSIYYELGLLRVIIVFKGPEPDIAETYIIDAHFIIQGQWMIVMTEASYFRI